MVRSNASPATYSDESDEVDEMHTDERIPRLVSDVAHLQSDVSEIKLETRALRADVNKLRDDMQTGFAKVREELHAQGKELRTEIQNQGKELRAEIGGVRGSIEKLTLELERFKGRQWIAIAVLYVLVALCLGGLPNVLARTLKLPW